MQEIESAPSVERQRADDASGIFRILAGFTRVEKLESAFSAAAFAVAIVGKIAGWW